MKNAFLLSMDALIAISVVILAAMFLTDLSFTYSSPELKYQRLYYAGKDILNVLESTEVSAVSDVVNLSDYNLQEADMNRSVLDVIGSLWAAGNVSEAGNLTKDVLNAVLNNTAYGYEVLMDGESIYRNGSYNLSYQARISAIVSGYAKEKPVNGYMAKVYLSKAKKTTSEFIYFGGYEGEGNITKIIALPDDVNVLEVYMEVNAGNNFTLYANNNNCGFYTITQRNMTSDKWIVCNGSYNPSCCLSFAGGANSINFNFTINESDYIGGGYIKVKYNTSELTGYVGSGENATDRYWFPGIKGIINLYSSFYVPGTLKNMSAYLHYKNNLSYNQTGIPVYLTIGENEVFRSSELGEKSITINNTYLNQTLNYTKLSNATIPLRFGTEPFAFLAGFGTSDSVLITDRSGSMDGCDVNSGCAPGICDSSSPCHEKRIEVAKDVDNEFVDTILNVSGNRIGLVGYGEKSCDSHSITNDSTSLESQINGYDAGCGCTCISCGVANSTELILNSKIIETPVQKKSSWLYNTNYPYTNPPNDINGSSWVDIVYLDSGWSSGAAILGFENVSYTPNIDTNIGNNNGSYFFRKHFNLTNANAIESADLYILSDDNAEVYLNGHLISNDTIKHNATYWNRIKGTLFSDNFENYYAQGARQIDGYNISRAPGFWYVDDGNGLPNTLGEEVFIMNGYLGYLARRWSALVFRDMDNYGYAETKMNLSGYSNLTLSYWWRLGPSSSFGVNEYGNVSIWDGSWHVVRTYNSTNDDDKYHYAEIDLSLYSMVNNFTIRFGSKSSDDNERFYVDDVVVRDKFPINASYFVEGENVIAVKLNNSDNKSAKFDLELNITRSRYKSMLVMSDGDANTRINGSACGDDALAKNESVEKACEARDYGVVLYSVAFGANAENYTLARIACWNCSANNWLPGEGLNNCSRFFQSNNADELEEIYRRIAKDIANATYRAQTINISGNVSLDNILYPDSYIEMNYSAVTQPITYGEITLTFESPRFGDLTGNNTITDNSTKTKEGWFSVPNNITNTKVLDSKVTSYSSYYWTDRLWVNSSNTPNQNWTNVYWLGNYSDEYEKLGDPFIVHIPANLIKPGGNNSVRIGSGLSPENGTGGSPDDRVIYTIGISGVSLTQYSDVFPKAKGSSVLIYYDIDGNNIPDGSSVISIGDPADIFDPGNDSLDDALVRLLDQLNFIYDNNTNIAVPVKPPYSNTTCGLDINNTCGDGDYYNPIDLEITPEVRFEYNYISEVPSLWGPANMEIRTWM
jgi:hypothetical protein